MTMNTETLEQYKRRVATAGGKARWASVSAEERSRQLSAARRLGIQRRQSESDSEQVKASESTSLEARLPDVH